MGPPPERGRCKHRVHALHLGPSRGQEALVHPRRRPRAVRPLPDAQGLLGGVARERRDPAVHQGARRARRGLRARQQGLPGVHGPGSHGARGRPARVARGAARQAVRGTPVRVGRPHQGQHRRPHRRLPRPHPHSRDDRPHRPRRLPWRARAHPGLEPAPRRHRPRVPPGAPVPGVVHPQGADVDRPDRVLLASAREAALPRRQPGEVRGIRRPVEADRQAPRRDRRLRPIRPDQRVPARRRGLPGDGLRGVPRARRCAPLWHPRVPSSQRPHRRRRGEDPPAWAASSS